MYFVNAPLLLRWYYPDVTWNRSREQKKLYLTFDDGPVPDITPWVLDTLKTFNVKATFFCVGENIEKNPEIFERLVADGHQVGNHTYNHLKGWNVEDEEYIANVAQCHELTKSALFRPPYARAKRSQIAVLKENYELIYWDVLSGDFDVHITPEQCFNNVIKHTRNGSIIVFHDNIKALPRLQYALPKMLNYFLEKGYTFHLL